MRIIRSIEKNSCKGYYIQLLHRRVDVNWKKDSRNTKIYANKKRNIFWWNETLTQFCSKRNFKKNHEKIIIKDYRQS